MKIFSYPPRRRVECGREEPPGDTLAAELEVDVGAERSHVIEGASVSSKRLHDLEAHQALVGPPDGYFPDAARRKVEEVVALGFDAERRVECGVHARLDDRIEDATNASASAGTASRTESSILKYSPSVTHGG